MFLVDTRSCRTWMGRQQQSVFGEVVREPLDCLLTLQPTGLHKIAEGGLRGPISTAFP